MEHREPILRATARWFRQRLGLLQAGSEACRLCGKAVAGAISSGGGHGTIAGLCSACTSGIPWIRSIRCAVCGRGIPCGDCVRRTDTSFVYNRSAVSYNADMKALLAQYKYRGSETLETTLADMLLPAYRQLTHEVALDAGIPHREADRAMGERRILGISRLVWRAVTFVPISAERAEERGFNQAERLAGLLGARFGLPVLPLLTRTRHTGKQSFKNRDERFRDMQDLFAPVPEGFGKLHALKRAAPPSRHAGTDRILLIDDIYTTGSTINACGTELRRAAGESAAVYALTWARS